MSKWKFFRLLSVRFISTHTINKYLSRLSNLFTYGVSHGYMNNNPASGLKVKLRPRPDQERKAFNSEDLQKLFNELPTLHPYMSWSPLIDYKLINP